MLWNGIRSIVNVKVKTQFSNTSHLLDNGTRVNDPVKMANLFNNYFVNVGLNIDKIIPRTTKSPTDYLTLNRPGLLESSTAGGADSAPLCNFLI